jgi:hypothetical protein
VHGTSIPKGKRAGGSNNMYLHIQVHIARDARFVRRLVALLRDVRYALHARSPVESVSP